jgi:hypothetical protein
VTHECSYSGGRDQEDLGLKPSSAISSREPILKKTLAKRVGGVSQGEGPECRPQYHKEKEETAVYAFWLFIVFQKKVFSCC